MTMGDKRLVYDLIRASILDITKTEKISKFIEDCMFKSEYDIYTFHKNCMVFLPHCCNDACLIKNPDGTFRYQKLETMLELAMKVQNTNLHTYKMTIQSHI